MLTVLLLAACAGTPSDTKGPADTDTADTSADSGDSDTGDSDTSDSADSDTDTDSAAADADADGWTVDAGDCDDADPAAYPGAPEACDGVDTDCDGLADDDDPDAGSTTWYADGDGDGWGLDATTLTACAPPDGYTGLSGDCDDTDATFHPDAPEDCSEPIDTNCDGSTAYADADGDGTAACDDCDDANPDVHPGAAEFCNGLDDDCDGGVDEGDAVDPLTWYFDNDGDGHGDPAVTTQACDQPPGWLPTADDCDDGDEETWPGATEYCDGIDNDCDTLVDADDPDVVDGYVVHTDADGDTYGDPATETTVCRIASDQVADGTDCDDTSAAAHPGAEEVCDGLDDDCDGSVDEAGATGELAWYVDLDGDGYGTDDSPAVTACDAPAGRASLDGDCDDTDDAYHPGATETLEDGLDQDCTGADQLVLPSGTHHDTDAVYTYTANGLYLDTFEMAPVLAEGDPDGDGLGQLVVEAYRDDDLPSAQEVVYLLPSPLPASGNIADVATTRYYAPDRLQVVGFGGDLDQDGTNELLIRHTVSSGGTQGADLVPVNLTGDVDLSDPTTVGGVSLRWSGTTGNDGMAGWVGDWDGDGWDDLAMSDTTRTAGGRVAVLSGPLSGDVNVSTDSVWSTLGASSHFGWVYPMPIPGGDLDGDGYADLAVDDWDTHVVYVCSGGATGTLPLATACPDSVVFTTGSVDASRNVVIDGDLDGDGNPDLVLGSLEDGTTRAFYGRPSGAVDSTTADLVLSTGVYSAGQSTTVKDVDRDGYAEVIVGAPYDDSAVTNGGAVFLFSGLAGGGSYTTADATASWLGTTYVLFGYAATDGLDLTDDAAGRPDLVSVGPYAASAYGLAVMVWPGE